MEEKLVQANAQLSAGKKSRMPYTRKRRRSLIFFAIIYLFFGAAFIFLFFFTPGLKFVQEEKDGKMQVFIYNESSHIIHDITVETSNGEVIVSGKKLKPLEKKQVDLGNRLGSMDLIAKAPYHPSAKINFVGVNPIKLNYKVTAPSKAFVGTNFLLDIIICNDGDPVTDLSVEETHDDFFLEENSAQKVSIAKGECKKVEFGFTPVKAGTTKIFFNVKAPSYSKELEREVTIEE